MNIEQIKDIHRRQPFNRYEIHLADGCSIKVPHSEYAFFFPQGRHMLVVKSNGGFHLIDTMLVCDVEVEPEAAA